MNNVDDLYGGYNDEDEELVMEGDDDDDEGWQDQEEDYMPTRRSPEISAIKKDSLSVAQQQDLSMVMGLFNIKQHHARALLIHYRWNTDRLGDHLERKGQERMLMEAGVVLQQQQQQQETSSRPCSRSRVLCEVCFEDLSPRHVSAMDCGHSFCDDCWTQHFVAALDLGKKQIRCMAFRCPAICDEAVVQRLLRRRDPAAAERLHDLLLRSYVDDNGAVKWCPSVPHCGRAIRVDAADEVEPLCEVRCPCGVSFCFRCAAAAHSPCPCAMWERWVAKGQGEAENVRWLLANTKSCPKCFKPIHKIDGCNLMTCSCGQHFCWLCGGATGSAHTWTSINNHSCNRFEQEEKRKVDDARRQVRRYEHYYKRFHGHGFSYKAERDKLGPAVAGHVLRLEWSGVLTRDAAWLTDAHGSLLRCRQVLARSYVFAYYMFDAEGTPTRRRDEPGSLSMAKTQQLFEDYQEQLEFHVERLSKLLGQDVAALLGPGPAVADDDELPEAEILKARQDATNLVRVVQAHCGKMYGCIQDELLPMLVEPMSIVAYQPGGPNKAHELPA